MDYEKVGRVEWFRKEYCAHCTEDCPEGSERWKACLLTNILFEAATQHGKFVYKQVERLGGK